jgi:drug/metabolite transporter (DMT)-like permease
MLPLSRFTLLLHAPSFMLCFVGAYSFPHVWPYCCLLTPLCFTLLLHVPPFVLCLATCLFLHASSYCFNLRYYCHSLPLVASLYVPSCFALLLALCQLVTPIPPPPPRRGVIFFFFFFFFGFCFPVFFFFFGGGGGGGARGGVFNFFLFSF